MRGLVVSSALFFGCVLLVGCASNNPANTAPAAMSAHPVMNSAFYGNDSSKYRGPTYQMPAGGSPVMGANAGGVR